MMTEADILERPATAHAGHWRQVWKYSSQIVQVDPPQEFLGRDLWLDSTPFATREEADEAARADIAESAAHDARMARYLTYVEARFFPGAPS